MGEQRDARQLAAAEACVDAIVAAGSTRIPVEELHRAAGISKRTFHRYFPYKAQAIRPHYAAMTATFAERVGAHELRSAEAWTRAWAEVVLGEDSSRSLRLFDLIRADPEFWSVFLHVVHDSERAFAEALRGDAADAPLTDDVALAAEVTAVALVASSRLALTAAVDEGADPVAAFARYLRAFEPPLFAAEHARG
jgi:AcrR family transcriptional regulator